MFLERDDASVESIQMAKQWTNTTLQSCRRFFRRWKIGKYLHHLDAPTRSDTRDPRPQN
tara:strand:+ start:289 stop:465 length:177 start_codon:yes stop_codon:yes gene_type:complete